MCSMFAYVHIECRILRLAVDLEIEALVAVCRFAGVNAKLVLLVLRFRVRWQDALTWSTVKTRLEGPDMNAYVVDSLAH